MSSGRTVYPYPNAGMGNRSVADHIKSQHNGAGKNGNAVSGMAKPARKPYSGESGKALKSPSRSHSKPSGLMD